MHRVLTKTPEEVKRQMCRLDVVKMAFDHFEWRYARLSDISTDTDDTEILDTVRNSKFVHSILYHIINNRSLLTATLNSAYSGGNFDVARVGS